MKAHDFASRIQLDDEKPEIAIEIIISILLIIIKECIINYSRIKHPTMTDRLKLYWICRKKTKKGRQITQELIKQASSLNEDEFHSLLQDLKGME